MRLLEELRVRLHVRYFHVSLACSGAMHIIPLIPPVCLLLSSMLRP